MRGERIAARAVTLCLAVQLLAVYSSVNTCNRVTLLRDVWQRGAGGADCVLERPRQAEPPAGVLRAVLGPLQLALRGGGYSIENDNTEGKDTEGWRYFREDSVLQSRLDSVRDPDDESQGPSAIDWDKLDLHGDPAEADPVTLPFARSREHLDAASQNFSVFMKDYLQENLNYELPPDPPFRGRKWVEELEAVFDRLQAEWEEKQMDGETAQSDGPYHARQGAFHKNPALDLTTSGCMERPWDRARLSHYARLRAEAGNVTKWRAERRADEDDGDESSIDVQTPLSTGVVDGQTRQHFPGDVTRREPLPAQQTFRPEYQAFRMYGEEDWGAKLALPGSMDANTDPWFQVNPDSTLTGLSIATDPYEGDWVQKTLEEHVQKQLRIFSRMCRETYEQRTNGSYAGRMTSQAAEEDQFIYDNIDKSASVSYRSRQRTCPLANNKWVNNVGSMPVLEWNPQTPREQTSLWSSMPPSFNQIKGAPKLAGIDGDNDGVEHGGWRNPGGDHLVRVEPEPEPQYEDSG